LNIPGVEDFVHQALEKMKGVGVGLEYSPKLFWRGGL
jgi:hypothetical protein